MAVQESLRIACVQANLYWENIPANLAAFEEKLASLEGGFDVVVLPEMFTTGFSMNPAAFAEPMGLHTFRWFKQQAMALNACITGSYIVKEGNEYYNRLLWMYPDGTYQYYDKRHLFRMAGENQHYAAGKQLITCEYKGWKIRPLICYDLRFPVWSRNVQNEYDLLIYVANWPERRSSAWSALLKARAIENLSYCIGLNRVGHDGNQVYHSGDSEGIDFKGDRLFYAQHDECVAQLSLSYAALQEYRERFPAFRDADSFSIDF